MMIKIIEVKSDAKSFKLSYVLAMFLISMMIMFISGCITLGKDFPEANVLIPLESVAKGSNTPTSKWVEVSVDLRKH